MFSHWPRLLQMDLSGNPACKKPKYRDRLIVACKSLGETQFMSLLYYIHVLYQIILFYISYFCTKHLLNGQMSLVLAPVDVKTQRWALFALQFEMFSCLFILQRSWTAGK